MIRNIFTSKSIWGAWLAYGFGLLAYTFTSPSALDSISTLGIVGLIIPPVLGLFIKWMDFRSTPKGEDHFLDLNPDGHFIRGFLSQFGGIIGWLLFASAYGIEDWYNNSINLAVFISGTLIASVIVHMLMLDEPGPSQEEEEIENGN